MNDNKTEVRPEWLPIPGTDDKYFINEDGQVKRVYENGNEYLLKPTINNKGYCIVSLSMKGNRNKTTTVNSLMKMVFGHADQAV